MERRSAHCCLCGEPRKPTQQPVASFGNNQHIIQMDQHRPMQIGRWEQSPQLLVSVLMWRNGGTNEHTHMCDGCILIGLQEAKSFVDKAIKDLS